MVVIGGGGHAKVVVSLLKKSVCDVVGYTDPVDGGAFLGVPYLGGDAVLARLFEDCPGCGAVLGVGKLAASLRRAHLQKQIEGIGFAFPVISSPDAVVNIEVALGAGTVVLDGVVINVGAVVGRACILNTHCTVEHDCRLGDDVHIAPGATVSGGVSVGSGSMIGAGATVIHGLTICEGCMIGAGSVVIKDINVPGTYAGNPARRLA